MARQLRTLHDALAKGKDFDLNGARRPALKNERRGPVPLTALRLAVERHLPDKAARRFFKDRIGVFWSGRAAIYAGNEREIRLIEEAIALASGAKRAQVVKRARAGVTALEKASAEPERNCKTGSLRYTMFFSSKARDRALSTRISHAMCATTTAMLNSPCVINSCAWPAVFQHRG